MRSSLVERFPDKKEAHGPIPCAPTGMTLCEKPGELPVQLKGDPHFYCPLKLGKGIKIGWDDPRFVVCSHLEECKALRASRRNHETSRKNTNYKARLSQTPTGVRVDGVPVANHRKSYPPDPLLAWSAKQNAENSF